MIEGLKELIKSLDNQILSQCTQFSDIRDAYSKLLTGLDYIRMLKLISLLEYNECYENLNIMANYIYEKIRGVTNDGDTNKN